MAAVGAGGKRFGPNATVFLPSTSGEAIAHHLVRAAAFTISIDAKKTSHHTHCHMRPSISGSAWLISVSDCMVAHLSAKCDTYFCHFP
jgi:hypothetical protein